MNWWSLSRWFPIIPIHLVVPTWERVDALDGFSRAAEPRGGNAYYAMKTCGCSGMGAEIGREPIILWFRRDHQFVDVLIHWSWLICHLFDTCLFVIYIYINYSWKYLLTNTERWRVEWLSHPDTLMWRPHSWWHLVLMIRRFLTKKGTLYISMAWPVPMLVSC